ncbi:MAG: phage terminase large subunit family protein [Negativicutes bacterium]|nr:phage terminase large subunit family protein [Negativicutes bacterium]
MASLPKVNSYSASNWPPYIADAFCVFKPPEKLTVSQWADKNRILDEKSSASPGAWKTERTPYLRKIMDVFCEDGIEEITFCAGSQLGKTEAEYNMLCYAVDQDPGPAVIVYPTDKLAEFASENRLIPMFELSPAVAEKFNRRASEKLELQFTNNYIALVGANSPSNLASRPVRYVFFDEIDKYPKWSGKEASPLALAEERMKTFYNRKIVKVSTPTTKHGNIWQAYLKSDLKLKYHVPCPHCGSRQQLDFKQVKWPQDMRDPQLVRYAAWYECVSCGQRIDDRHKMEMLRNGEWVPENTPIGRVRSVGFHLSSIYSPWLTFGDVAAKFLASKDTPEDLMNFVNSWLAEPWEEKAASLDSDLVMSRQTNIPAGVVPEYAQLLTAGVDVQVNRMYWTIRAWGARMTSQNIAHGEVEAWADLEKIMNRRWPDQNGELRWVVNLCAIDSGYDTETVYEFCLMNQDWAVPVKGSSNPMLQRYRKTSIDSPGSKFHGQTLYILDTDQYKNMIAARLNRDTGEGCFMVHADCDLDYATQLTSEHRVRERKGNKEVETWKQKTSATPNHYLDCEVYAALAADLLHVRYLEDLPAQEPAYSVREEQEWIKVKEDWLE